MTIQEFEQKNIKNVVVTPRLNGTMNHIKANDGLRILIPENIQIDEDGNTKRILKKSVILSNNYPFDTISVLNEAEKTENDTLA